MNQPELFPVKVSGEASFSLCRKYRYSLLRRWAPPQEPDKPALRYCMFIGLNPSTADERADDPTIRRCIRFARGWGYDGLVMANVFPLRSTDPKSLALTPVPRNELRRNWQAIAAEIRDCPL
ncbi:MAG: DUF1643 domain-containing protein, partial [Pirellulales bacterium]|nr:DUF1643 domain-containing protein [Pirellulales bacterium]